MFGRHLTASFPSISWVRYIPITLTSESAPDEPNRIRPSGDTLGNVPARSAPLCLQRTLLPSDMWRPCGAVGGAWVRQALDPKLERFPACFPQTVPAGQPTSSQIRTTNKVGLTRPHLR